MELLKLIAVLFMMGAISFLIAFIKIALKKQSKIALRKIEKYELFLNK